MKEKKNFLEKFRHLFLRAASRLRTSKALRKVEALGLALAIGFTLGSCDIFNSPNNPSYNENENQNQNNNENNSQNDNNNGNEENNKNDFSEYSQLLQNVLNNEEYDEILANYTNETNPDEIGYFKPHPYKFLEGQGIDIEAIKNNETEAYTLSYILDEEPNNLYMHTRVLTDNSYWTSYLLKYTLTDEEVDDYHSMHTGGGGVYYYIQAMFMNNEISKMKTPEIVGTSKWDKEAYDNLHKGYPDNSETADDFNLIFMNPNKKEYSFDLYIVPGKTRNNRMTISSTTVKKLSCEDLLLTQNDIYITPSTYYTIYASSETDYEATVYLTQNPDINLISLRNFETIKK